MKTTSHSVVDTFINNLPRRVLRFCRFYLFIGGSPPNSFQTKIVLGL